MKNLFNFYQFITESSSAGSKIYSGIDFKFARKDLRDGYTIDDLIRDIHSYGDKNSQIRDTITQIIDQYTKKLEIKSIRELDNLSLNEFIRKVEKVIENKGEPEIIQMPSGSFLFLKDHQTRDGKICDFYMNRKKTKIEVVFVDASGEEDSRLIPIEEFSPEEFGISGDELQKFMNLKEID